MAQNVELENAVLGGMYNHIKTQDSTLEMMSDGSEEVGRELLRTQAQTMVDLAHRVRLHVGSFIGYGYDFMRVDEEDRTPARKVYDRAVKNTKERPFGGVGETLVAEGIVNNQFGWYVTELPR